MQTIRTINVVGCHAAGEVGHVITGGVLPPPGNSVLEQRDWLMENDDSLRKLLIREPRGGVFCHYNLIVPAKHADAQAGFIIMEPCDYPPMSGSNATCVGTVLLETGMIPMIEPETQLVLEAPAGLVHMTAKCKDGRVESVTTRNVPCFVEQLDAPVEVEGIGTVNVDLVYGGDFYAQVDAASVGLTLARDEARDIVELGERIKAAARETYAFPHPLEPTMGGISFVEFFGPLEEVEGLKSAKNCTVISPGKIDRSPCGTGSSARATALHARGLLKVGETYLSRSILETRFWIHVEREAEVGGKKGIQPTITGSAWITGHHVYTLDPNDPFPEGYSLTDTAYAVY